MKRRIIIQKSNLNLSTNEEEANLNLYAIDYLKIEIQLTNNPSELSEKVVIPFVKCGTEYFPQQESYGQQWIQGSHGDQIQIKSKNENTLLIQGNFFKWLYGHNVTGTTDLMGLVVETVRQLLQRYDALMPTQDELDNIKQGMFKIHRIDLNKAILFPDKEAAQLYLAIIKEHGTYSIFEKLNKVDKPTLSFEYFIKENLIPDAPIQGRRTNRDKASDDPIRIFLAHIFNEFTNESVNTDYPDEANLENASFPEGAKQTVLVNRYERNSEARAKCIEFHKARCKVCEMSFEETYGFFAKDFIHVHHITPLHQISESYDVNPETDLIPVCPNCHAMLHRQENGIPMTVERLRLLFEVSKNSKM